MSTVLTVYGSTMLTSYLFFLTCFLVAGPHPKRREVRDDGGWTGSLVVAHRLDYKDYHSAPGEKRHKTKRRERTRAQTSVGSLFSAH